MNNNVVEWSALVKYSGPVPEIDGVSKRLTTPNLAKVPFVFGCLDAESVPGPLLVELLGDLGIAAAAARTLLSRMRETGLLSVEPRGRVSVYRLGRMRDQFLRIRGDAGPPWDGTFRTIVYDVPERERRTRDRLLAQAERLGFGQPRPGVLVGPWDRTPGLSAEIARARAVGFVVVGELTLPDDEARLLARQAFGLDDLAARMRAEIAALEPIPADSTLSDADAFRELEGRPRAARQLIGTAADVPAALRPGEWPAAELGRAVDALGALLGPAAGRHVRRRVEQSRYRNLLG